MQKRVTLSCILFILAFASIQTMAAERPPVNAKPLSDIIKRLENQGYAPVIEVSLDDGVWEVEAYKDNVLRELLVHPATGEIHSDRIDE